MNVPVADGVAHFDPDPDPAQQRLEVDVEAPDGGIRGAGGQQRSGNS